MIISTRTLLESNRKTISNRNDQTMMNSINCENNNKSNKEVKDRERDQDLFRQFPNRPRYGYVCPQSEIEFRYLQLTLSLQKCLYKR